MLSHGYIIGGFASLKIYYWPLQYLLKKHGLDVELIHPGPLGLNIWPLSSFEAEISRILDTLDHPIFLIGHSLGGIQAVWSAHSHPDKIQKVFAIASPLHGSPWAVYEEGIRTLLNVSLERYNEFKHIMLPSVAPKLITISSMSDVLAPIGQCAVKDAKNYSIEVGDEFIATCHLIMPYLSAS